MYNVTRCWGIHLPLSQFPELSDKFPERDEISHSDGNCLESGVVIGQK